ncbi:MAG: hypothetical protein IKT14_06380, partial [Clostridiales bacterium]|nr:hypothetical protein [Clostridiales bacterium]
MKNIFKNKKFVGIASAAVAAMVIIPNVLQMGSLAAPSAADAGKAVPDTLDAASSVNYATILGRAVDYGVITMDFHQRMHMESPIATYNFYNDVGEADEVDFIDSDHTAQFIVGNVLNGHLRFGARQSPGSFHIELGNPGDYPDGVSHPGALKEDIIFDNMNSQSTPLENYYFTYRDQDYIYNNIYHIVNDAETQADAITDKIDNGYAINLSDYTDYTPQKDACTLNLYYEEFKNRVIYIDVDDDLMKVIGSSNSLTIEKYDSTIIVFNVNNNVTTNAYEDLDDFGKGGTNEQGLVFGQFRVLAHDDATGNIIGDGVNEKPDGIDGLTSESPSQAFKDAGKLAEAELDDQHINQKIIWNVTKPNVPVRFDATGGTFLLTGHNPADLSTSSAGWVVTNGEFFLTQEWHYEYNGGSQDAPVDGEFEFHFALHKTFADKLSDTPDDDRIDSILTNAGDFHFALYQYTDSNYDQSTATLVDTDDTLATNKVMFDPMKFDPDDAVYDDGTETFYYRIYETNTDVVTSDGYKIFPNPDSYIEIRLVVNKTVDPVKGTQMSFVVDHTTHLIDGNGTEYIYHVNNDIGMSGVEFDVGNFYNVAIETGSIKVDKYISNTNTYLAGATFTLTSSNADLSGATVTGAASKTIATDCVTFTTSDGRVTIAGLENGDYVLTETSSATDYSKDGKTNIVTFNVNNGTVTNNTAGLPATSDTDTSFTNGIYTFNNDASKGSITVTKTLSANNANTAAAGQDFEFYVEAYDNGNFAGYVKADGTLDTSKYLFTVEEGDAAGTKVDNLDFAYTYKVVEYTDTTSLAASYAGTDYQLEEPAYTGNDVALSATTPTGDVEIENTYTRVYQYSINISKNVVGATMSDSGTFPIIITYSEYDADAGRDVTYYLKVQNGVITREGNANYTPDPQNCVSELSVNEPIVLQGEYIKEGITYTIYELTDGNSDVYDRANEAYRFDPQDTHTLTQITVNGNVTNTIDVTLSSNEKTKDVVFVNTYDNQQPEVAYIDLTKTIGGDVDENDLQNLTFTVYDASDDSVVATV